MLGRSESCGPVLPSLTKLQSQQQPPHPQRHFLSKQSKLPDEFLSLQSDDNSTHSSLERPLQEKPLPTSLLVTIPTTPVKRRRHRNDAAPPSKDTKTFTRNIIQKCDSIQDPLSVMSSGNNTLRNISSRTLKRAETVSSISTSPVKLPGVKLASPNISKFELSKERLFKYRQWFMSIDADDSGTVDRSELFDSFVSSGVVASEKVCSKLFEVMDVDGTGEVDFDNFIRTIMSSSMSKAVQMHKLDAMITNQSALSTETLLSQERRKILMKFVVDKDTLHDFEMDSLTTDDQKASKKLAKLHQPMNESKSKIKRNSASKNVFTTSEIDSIAASMKSKKPSRALSSSPSFEELPKKANMERRVTRMNGRSLGINCDEGNVAEKQQPTGNLSKSILQFQKVVKFDVVDMIKKKNQKIAEERKHAAVQDVVCQVIANDKKILQKQSSRVESDESKISLGEGALGPLSAVLPAEVMKMMQKQDDGLYKFHAPDKISVVEEAEEEGEEEEKEKEMEKEKEKKEVEKEPMSESIAVSSSIQKRMSPIKLSTRPSSKMLKKKLSFRSDDQPGGGAMVLRPIGCHHH